MVLEVLLALGVLGWRTSREKSNGEAPRIAQKGDTPKGGYRPCVGWLELVLEVLLALGVLGWRTS